MRLALHFDVAAPIFFLRQIRQHFGQSRSHFVGREERGQPVIINGQRADQDRERAHEDRIGVPFTQPQEQVLFVQHDIQHGAILIG